MFHVFVSEVRIASYVTCQEHHSLDSNVAQNRSSVIICICLGVHDDVFGWPVLFHCVIAVSWWLRGRLIHMRGLVKPVQILQD